MTAADILFRVAIFISNSAPELEEQDYIVHSIWFDEVARETQFIPFTVPDMFLADVQAALKCGWRPIALEINEEDEAEEYACLGVEFFKDNPSVEDTVIVDSMFEMSEEGVVE